MKNPVRLLTPAAVNKALDKINANPAKRGKQVFVPTRSKQKAIDYAKEKHGIDAGIAVKVQGGFIVYQAYDTNPARKTRAVRVVAAKNPTKSSDVPGDFSQSSAKVYGRAWVDAKSAAVEDFGDVTQVKLIWSDGEWLQMLFDNKTAAMNHLKRLGFSVNK